MPRPKSHQPERESWDLNIGVSAPKAHDVLILYASLTLLYD